MNGKSANPLTVEALRRAKFNDTVTTPSSNSNDTNTSNANSKGKDCVVGSLMPYSPSPSSYKTPSPVTNPLLPQARHALNEGNDKK